MAKKKAEVPAPPPFPDRIVGHESVIERLEKTIRRNRVAHAYVFSGPDGVGKRTVAFQFAVMLLDDRRRVAEGTHPQFFYLARVEGKQNIAISQVADLLRSLALKPLLPKPRVIVIDEADRLSEEAMNSLLKTLEEPPERCVFLLVTASPSSLLATIRSRCHAVRFGPLPQDRVREHLESVGWKKSDAALATRLTGGRIGKALAGSEAITEARATLDETLDHILKQNVNAIVESLTRIRNPQKSREQAILTIDLVLLAFREAYRARVEGRKPDADLLPESFTNAFDKLTEEDLVQRMDVLLDHRHYLDLNANVGLTVENALIRI